MLKMRAASCRGLAAFAVSGTRICFRDQILNNEIGQQVEHQIEFLIRERHLRRAIPAAARQPFRPNAHDVGGCAWFEEPDAIRQPVASHQAQVCVLPHGSWVARRIDPARDAARGLGEHFLCHVIASCAWGIAFQYMQVYRHNCAMPLRDNA
jgi:hypothetical protein